MTNEEAKEIIECREMIEAMSERANEALDIAIEALEHTRWIPVSEMLPESPYGCLVTVMDTNPMTCDEFENIYPDFVGWDGENWNDADGYSIPFEVIAWMPLPQPYMAESEVQDADSD